MEVKIKRRLQKRATSQITAGRAVGYVRADCGPSYCGAGFTAGSGFQPAQGFSTDALVTIYLYTKPKFLYWYSLISLRSISEERAIYKCH